MSISTAYTFGTIAHPYATTMVGAGLTPDGVMDLIPVKPLAPIEPTVRQAYRDTLAALHQKLSG